MRVHASWVASSLGTGVVWKWSYTHTLLHGPASACSASEWIVLQWSFVGIPTRSNRQPSGKKKTCLHRHGAEPIRVPSG